MRWETKDKGRGGRKRDGKHNRRLYRVYVSARKLISKTSIHKQKGEKTNGNKADNTQNGFLLHAQVSSKNELV